jgi:hypothetical protein
MTLCNSCHRIEEWDEELVFCDSGTPILEHGELLAEIFEIADSHCPICGELQSECLGSCDCVDCIWRKKFLKEQGWTDEELQELQP